ncbi:hypothetical protein LINGRAHAP2_LOCUS3886, partial [Linum grandiflorum]
PRFRDVEGIFPLWACVFSLCGALFCESDFQIRVWLLRSGFSDSALGYKGSHFVVCFSFFISFIYLLASFIA